MERARQFDAASINWFWSKDWLEYWRMARWEPPVMLICIAWGKVPCISAENTHGPRLLMPSIFPEVTGLCREKEDGTRGIKGG